MMPAMPTIDPLPQLPAGWRLLLPPILRRLQNSREHSAILDGRHPWSPSLHKALQDLQARRVELAARFLRMRRSR
jgi:hypothetical protein